MVFFQGLGLKQGAKRRVRKLFSALGLEVTGKPARPPRPGVNLNVGCGAYEIEGFESLDFDTPHYYPKHFRNRTHYDMRGDPLPYGDDSVDTIYCSHVVEHIESEFVVGFLEEAHRVLKAEGVLRIACPDSKFLYQQFRENPEFWVWHPKFQGLSDVVGIFVDELGGGLSVDPAFLLELEYDELMHRLREHGEFDGANPGRHINNFDFERLRGLGQNAGFTSVFESRFGASIHPDLQGHDMDRTAPQKSLYVDFRK